MIEGLSTVMHVHIINFHMLTLTYVHPWQTCVVDVACLEFIKAVNIIDITQLHTLSHFIFLK